MDKAQTQAKIKRRLNLQRRRINQRMRTATYPIPSQDKYPGHILVEIRAKKGVG